MALVRACPDIEALSIHVDGVTGFLHARGQHVEVIVPAGIRTYVAGVWITPDRTMSVLGSNEVTLGFGSGVDHDVIFMVKCRDVVGWLRWHHMRARSDPSASDARFFEKSGADVVIYTGLAAGAPASVKPAYIDESEESADFAVESYTQAGVVDVASFGATIRPLRDKLWVGCVELAETVGLGLGRGLESVHVQVDLGKGPAVGQEVVYSFTMAQGEDEYALDDGGPSDDGRGGSMFGDAYF